MDHLCISKNDECHDFINTNNDLNSSLFLDFPSPFFDDISNIPILEKNQTHQHQLISSLSKPLNTFESSSPNESKSTKKRRVGKKDRHSKINTAQGLRDRRMRLSLHIARKFFDLQDLLGFDKASKTIEWLFCKSNKAIKEVADNFNPQQFNNQDIERMDSLLTIEMIKAATSKLDSTKEEEEIIKKRKQVHNNLSAKETRDLARARARERTRERLMVKELEKSKHSSRGIINPNNDEIYRFGLYCLANSNDHSLEELGYISNSSKPVQQEPLGRLSFEHSSSTHSHLLQDLEPVNGFNNYSGWLNNRFSEMAGDWDAGSFMTGNCDDYGIVSSLGHFTGDTGCPSQSTPFGNFTSDIYELNPSSFLVSGISNITQFQSQNQGN